MDSILKWRSWREGVKGAPLDSQKFAKNWVKEEENQK